MVMKKGQMKIQQTAFMLVALTLFFVLLGLFLLSFVLSDAKGEAARLNEQDARLLVSKLANSPEFACGGSFGPGKETNCVDFDKAMALKSLERKYREENFWHVEDIKIRKVYPAMDDDIACTDATYPDCKTLHVFHDELVGTYVSNYVSLCYKGDLDGYGYDHCDVALLMVSYEVPT